MHPLILGNLDLIPIPAGQFLMGSPNEFFAEAPAHPVTIPRPFALGKYPVTQSQWFAVTGQQPSASAFADAPDHPVDSVTWDQAVDFCRQLSAQSGRSVRLPSEAEWEYACRAGTTTDFFFGPWGPLNDESEVPREAKESLDDYAWFDLNSGDRTQPVGLKLPNPSGLHDMLGNVWEWCADVWHGNYQAAPHDGAAWIEGADRQPRRCLRGGAWDMNAFRCRSSYRSFDHRNLATNRFGLRIVVDP